MKTRFAWTTIATLTLAVTSAWAADPMPAHAAHAAHAAHGTAAHGMGATPAAAPAPLVDAEVRRVDAAGGKLTLKHGPLTHLDMGAMTMAFAVKDPAWLKTVKVGDKVRVGVERVNGLLTVVALEPVAP